MRNFLRSKNTAVLFVTVLTVFSAIVYADAKKYITVDSAAVVCSERKAGEAGLEMLQAGGNAIDALVATAFTMAVTYPRAGNIGGGGFLIFRKSNGDVIALDFRETAPLSSASDMFLDENGNPVEDKSKIGALAVGVPGTVRGLYEAHRSFGQLSWNGVLQPAIQLARDGFSVDKDFLQSLEEKKKNLSKFAETRKIFFPGGQLPAEGDLFFQPDLANTLARIAEFGDSVFYEGDIADKVIATAQNYGGILSKSDFTDYKTVYREPVEFDYRGYRIYSMPPPSSGGLVLQGILNTLQQVDLAQEYSHNSADYVAFVSEIEKHWYAYRNLYLGDPDFSKIPTNLFLSAEKAEDILSAVSIKRPLPSDEMAEFRLILNKEKNETTHISILDAQGNAVAMTYTLNGSFGSFLAAEGTGILLNNEMDDFTVKPGHPNLYGLVQGRVNAIEPNKRMLSSMTPTVVEKDGQVVGMLGSPGGSKIITSVLQILLNKIDYQMSLSDAMTAGRFHQQWLPDSIYYEENKIPLTIAEDLSKRGFKMSAIDKIGDIQAIWRVNDKWEACSDLNGNGEPVGY
jgi:gamma-glutamyltranspeptidase/glutathione hydrolase